MRFDIHARTALVSAVGSLGLLALANQASAGIIPYGNFVGTDFSYDNVAENPTQVPGPDPAYLFGTPAVSGDILNFPNLSFVSGASGGNTIIQDGELSTTVQTNTLSSSISSFSIGELGDFSLVGGTTATQVEASLIVNQLLITQINGSSITPIPVLPTYTVTDNITSGSATAATGPGNVTFTSHGGISTGTWAIGASFNLAAAEAADGVTGNITQMTVTLDNTLLDNSESNSSALIRKKGFDLQTSSVPEPATASLALLGAPAMLLKRKRRHRQD